MVAPLASGSLHLHSGTAESQCFPFSKVGRDYLLAPPGRDNAQQALSWEAPGGLVQAGPDLNRFLRGARNDSKVGLTSGSSACFVEPFPGLGVVVTYRRVA